MGWLSLLSLGMLLAVAFLWGFYGSIASDVIGNGILIKSGGVMGIEAITSGQVTAIYVNIGDIVSRGQLVARVAQPKLIDDTNQLKADLTRLKRQYKKKAEYGDEDMKMKMENYEKQRADYERSIQNTQERLKWLNEILANRQKLFEQGLIRKQDFLSTQKDIFDAKEQIDKVRSDIKTINVNELDLKNNLALDLLSKKHEIDGKETEIINAEDELERKSRVLSPYTGAVVEVSVSEGISVNTGDKLVTLELQGDAIKDLEAILYFNPRDGKRVRAGMKVQISPSTVKREEWGCMVGMVTYVSTFPATRSRMLRQLQNDKLIDSFSSSGAPIEIYADLIPDPHTESGYKWSSSKGPPLKVDHGTVCSATVAVEEQRPISLVIPLFKKYILGIGLDYVQGKGP